MKEDETQKYAFLKAFKTEQLDTLMSSILHEMRRRDSDHVKRDVMDSSRSLRSLRSSSKLP